MDGLAKGTLMRGTLSARRRQRAGGGLSGTIGSRSVGSWKAHRGKCWLLYARFDARILVTRREGSGEVFEYTAVEVIIHFYGVREAGEVCTYTVPGKYLYTSPTPEKYLYIGLHLSNTFPGQKKATVVFKYTSPAPEKYLYTPCRRSIYALLRRRRSVYMHRRRSIYIHPFASR